MSITLVNTGNNERSRSAMGWYRKHFTLPAGFAGKKVIVQFDGVYHDSKIYLNGTPGREPAIRLCQLFMRLTSVSQRHGRQCARGVRRQSNEPPFAVVFGDRHFRHVWLIATDKVYVRNWGTAVTTTAPTAASSQMRVQTEVVNDLTTAQTRTVETTIYDEAGNALQTTTTPITMAAGTSTPACRR
jgi:beta-galactosidase